MAKKGISYFAGFVGQALIPPPEINKPPQEKNELRKCPVCQRKFSWPPDKNFICSGCGYDESTNKRQPEIVAPVWSICKYCGKSFPIRAKDTTVCRACESEIAAGKAKIIQCARCGKEILARNTLRRFCDKCNIERSREQEKIRKQMKRKTNNVKRSEKTQAQG